MRTWPEDLFQFAFIPDVNNRLTDLAKEAEDEDWEYHNTQSQYPRPILYNYIRYTYRRPRRTTVVFQRLVPARPSGTQLVL